MQVLVERYGSFTSLLAAEENQLKGLLHGSDSGNKEAEKLISALKNLREHTGSYYEDSKDFIFNNLFAKITGKCVVLETLI